MNTANQTHFTPGSWHVAYTHESNPFVTNSTGKLSVANSINGQTTEEQFANALLISLAPELVEALRGMVQRANSAAFLSNPKNVQSIENARAVLAKLEAPDGFCRPLHP